MTACITSWRREDSFACTWMTLKSTSCSKAVLRVAIDVRPDDGFSAPKGSRILFGTASRMRMFYVTSPAEGGAASSAPERSPL